VEKEVVGGERGVLESKEEGPQAKVRWGWKEAGTRAKEANESRGTTGSTGEASTELTVMHDAPERLRPERQGRRFLTRERMEGRGGEG